MERKRQLDAAGPSPTRRKLIAAALAVALITFASMQLFAQATPSSQSYPQETPAVSSADAEFARGIALAEAGHLGDARSTFLRASLLHPRDPRFPTELGGIAFKQKQYREAIHWLRRARELAPNDTYLRDFLGTLYFIQGRQAAAISEWNQIDKPVVEDIRVQPGLRVDPVLLDRSLAFSRGEPLTVTDLFTTEARLRALGVYPMFSLRLAARPDGKFHVDFAAQELNGFGGGWEALLGTFRGAFYQTITPEYYNIVGTATNITTLWRWDAEKRRVGAVVSGPLHRNPKWRYRTGLDWRNENWDVQNFSALPGASLGFLNMRRSAAGAEITSVKDARFIWSAGGEISYRDFRCGDGAVPRPCVLTDTVQQQGPPALLASGYQLKQRASLAYDLLRLPKKQYRLTVGVQSELARLWAGDGSVFEKLQGELSQSWTLTDQADGPQLTTAARAGKTFGTPPFDELFMLGAERDNPLLMHAHIGTNNAGRKGNAPLGRNYFLWNNDIDKKIWGNGLFAMRFGPFVDIGKITDPLPSLGSSKWLVDAGGQLTVRVLGLQLRASYGRDLRAGRGAFYTWVGK